MEYKIIKKSPRGKDILTRDKNFCGINITEKSLIFSTLFNKRFNPELDKRYIVFAEDEGHNLCFRITNKETKNAYHAYCHSINTFGLTLPAKLKERVIVPDRYDVQQDGEWFTTKCQLKPY